MKVLILGAGSETALELAALLEARGISYSLLDSRGLERETLASRLSDAGATAAVHLPDCPDFVTMERDPAAAVCEALDSAWVTALAAACAWLDLPLVHLSSSLVFDGSKKAPYAEEEPCNPRGRYGNLMWQGEMTLREHHARHVIVRGDWLFGTRDLPWFERKLEACRLGEGRLELLDRRFSPTPAADMARVLVAVLLQVDCHSQVWGTYHYCSLQPLSEAQFVEGLIREAARHDPGLARLCEALEITVQPPPLPWIPNTALNCQKIMETFGVKQRSRAPALNWLLEELYQVPHAPVEERTVPVIPAVSSPSMRERGKRKRSPRKAGGRKRSTGPEPAVATEALARKAAAKKP